jgi:hypothetical protein
MRLDSSLAPLLAAVLVTACADDASESGSGGGGASSASTADGVPTGGETTTTGAGDPSSGTATSVGGQGPGGGSVAGTGGSGNGSGSGAGGADTSPGSGGDTGSGSGGDASASGTGGTGGSSGSGTGGDGNGGGGVGGGGQFIDECGLGLDDCLRGERCSDLLEGFECIPYRVLILEESVDSLVIGQALEALGAEVVEGPGFGAWDGADPALDDVDAVLWFEGVSWFDVMGDAAQTALAEWVANGGGLVRTEWAAFVSGSRSGPADALLPVTYDGTYTFGNTWRRVVPGAFVGESLDDVFTDDVAGWASVTPIAEADVDWQDEDGVPLVASTTTFGGRVVYVNHDATHSGAIGPDMVVVLTDAALSAAGAP